MASTSGSLALSQPRPCVQFSGSSCSSLLVRRLLSCAGALPDFPALTEKGFRAPTAALRSRVLCSLGNEQRVVTGDSWDRLILKSEVPALVEFHASWCGPCRMVHRVIHEISGEYAGRVDCFIFNLDDDLDLVEAYKIKAVPTVLVMKNGKKVDAIVGTMPKEFYVAAINKALA